MRKLYRLVPGLLFAFAQIPQSLFSCTVFVADAKQGPIYARNYDFHMGEGMMVINPRRSTKLSLPVRKSDKMTKWTSKYGSVTFNQFGLEFPLGGVNEAGLVVESLWLDATQYPAPDKRPSVNELQWVQYQLDNYASIDEVEKNKDKLRISKLMANLHYFICDSKGECAVMEFLKITDKETGKEESKAVLQRGKNLPVRALANNTYATSVMQMRLEGLDIDLTPFAQGTSSPARFRGACQARLEIDRTHPELTDAVAQAFESLGKVAQGEFTKWSVVYDLAGKALYYRRNGDPQEKRLALSEIDFRKRKVEGWNLESTDSGNIRAKFSPVTSAMHRKAVEVGAEALAKKFGPVPKSFIEAFKWYPITVWR